MISAKKYFLKFILWLSPVLLAFALMEYVAQQIPSEMAGLVEEVQSKSSTAQVLFLGTSHFTDGVNSTMFSVPVVNAADPLQGLCVSSRLGKKLVERMPLLKVVVLEAAYFSRDYQMAGYSHSTRIHDYFRYFRIFSDGDWLDTLNLKNYSRYVLFGKETVLSFIKDRTPTLPSTVQGAYQLNELGGSNEAEFHEGLIKGQNGERNLREFKKFSELLNKKGIALYLVVTPALEYYRAKIDKNTFRAVQNDMRIAGGIDESHFKNYFEDSRFSIEDFKNVAHLNEQGRTKFSKILNQEIVIPEIAAGQGLQRSLSSQ